MYSFLVDSTETSVKKDPRNKWECLQDTDCKSSAYFLQCLALWVTVKQVIHECK